MNNIIQSLASGANPMMVLLHAARSNPVASQAMKMMNGKNPQQIQQMAVNMCRERGTTPEDVLHRLGMR